MPITALPSLDRTSLTFKADVDTFFVSRLPAFSTEATALETNVNAKESSATASANTATTKAAEALASANAAATSKTGADTARDAAIAARTAAETALDSFDDRYLGPKATAPTLDNDGAALLVGALYWNSAASEMRVWSGSVWAAAYLPAGAYALLAGSATQAFSAATLNGAPDLHINDIINGDFRISQAGASFAAPAHFAYDLDGWFNRNVSTSVFTVAQAVGSTAGRLARSVTITTAATTVAANHIVVDATSIEGFNVGKYVGQTFTVAFQARVPVAGIHCVSLGNAGANRSYVAEINFPTANVYQACSFTVTGGLPTAGTWDYTNGVGLSISFIHMCGTNFHTTPNAWQTGSFFATVNQVNDCATVGNVWAMEKVTLNLGTVAAVSEISYEQELIRCQRYFELLPTWFNYAPVTSANTYGSSWTTFASVKRANPAMAWVSNATVNGFPNTAQTLRNVTAGGFSVTAVSNATVLAGEFGANWTASARL